MVQRIESFRAELEGQPFPDLEITVNTEIKNVESGALDRAALGSTRDKAGRCGRRESSRIEPWRRR